MTRSPLLLAAATLVLCACAPSQQHAHVTAPAGNWISLFNGKDLSNWTVKIAGHEVNDNFGDTFRVDNGVLKVAYDKYDKFDNQFGSLFSNMKLSHYWIRVEYRFVGSQVAGAPSWAYKNSGLQLHSQTPQSMRRDQQFPVNVEFDFVGGHFIGNKPTGDVCQNGTSFKIQGVPLKGKCSTLSDLTIRDEQWVTAEAEVDGAKQVRQIVDGEEIVAYTDLALDPSDPDAQRLLAAGATPALSSGYISLQSNGHPVEFRRIEVLPLEDAAAAGTATAATVAAPAAK